MHVPVLLKETILALDLSPGEFAIDGTVGGGGHAAEILERIRPGGTLLGLDRDPERIRDCEKKFRGNDDAVFVRGNYADLPDILAERGPKKADAILLDLGFSSDQLRSGRGMSFDPASAEELLLLTYDPEATPAYEVLKTMREEEVEKVLREFGEERFAKRIAREIYSRERRNPIATNHDLAETVARAVPRSYERGRIHPATRTFQALRIHVNDELGSLSRFLARLTDILGAGGRVAIISFHSLEDRIVKRAFRDFEKQGMLSLLTKKPIRPTREEAEANPRSRSAKLRTAKIN